LVYYRQKNFSVIALTGSKDKLIPPSIDKEAIIIDGGEHFMIVDKGELISDLINQYMAKQLQ